MRSAPAFFLAAALSAAGTDQVMKLSAVADTGLYEFAPTNNLGAVTDVPLGVHSDGTRSRLLVKFDPGAALPAGARVSSAELTLIVTKANTGGLLCNLHRVLRSWAEGSEIGGGNGAPAVQGETTWLARFHPDTFWDAPGATNGIDFSSAPSATAVLGGAGSANVLTAPALAADVQAWLDQPASNFGWVLLASDETVVQTARRIGSRENSDAPPALTVHFRVGPQLYGPALNAGFFSFWFDAASNQGYAVEYRSSLREGDWQTLTNIAPLSSPATPCINDAACAESRFYRVRVE